MNLKVEKRWDAQRFYDYVFTYRTYVGRFLQLIFGREILRPRKIFENFDPKSGQNRT